MQAQPAINTNRERPAICGSCRVLLTLAFGNRLWYSQYATCPVRRGALTRDRTRSLSGHQSTHFEPLVRSADNGIEHEGMPLARRSRMVQAHGVDYEQGADSYAAHRQIHPGVLQELYQMGQLDSGCRLLEVGCGTGNYAKALASQVGCVSFGLDPASVMLAHARAQPEGVAWVLGQAERLNFTNDTFDLIFSVDVIHHLSDKAAFYREVCRSLRPGGRVCTVTDSEEIIRRREILAGYFPETVEPELARYPRRQRRSLPTPRRGILCAPPHF